MFTRVDFGASAETLAITAFAITLLVFLVAVYRAFRTKPNHLRRMARLPLEDHLPGGPLP